MVLHECGAENFVLPIGSGPENRGVAECVVELVFLNLALIEELILIKGIFSKIHHVDFLGDFLPCHISRIAHVGASALAAACGDDHYAVGAGGTVYGAGRCVFEHVDADNIARGDGCEGIHLCLAIGAAGPVEASDIACGGGELHAVYNIKRLIGAVDGARAADADGCGAAGGSRVGGHLHAGEAPLKHLVDVGHNRLVHLLLCERRHRAGEVNSFLCAVAYHNHFPEVGGVVFECHCDVAASVELTFCVSIPT